MKLIRRCLAFFFVLKARNTTNRSQDTRVSLSKPAEPSLWEVCCGITGKLAIHSSEPMGGPQRQEWPLAGAVVTAKTVPVTAWPGLSDLRFRLQLLYCARFWSTQVQSTGFSGVLCSSTARGEAAPPPAASGLRPALHGSCLTFLCLSRHPPFSSGLGLLRLPLILGFKTHPVMQGGRLSPPCEP